MPPSVDDVASSRERNVSGSSSHVDLGSANGSSIHAGPAPRANQPLAALPKIAVSDATAAVAQTSPPPPTPGTTADDSDPWEDDDGSGDDDDDDDESSTASSISSLDERASGSGGRATEADVDVTLNGSTEGEAEEEAQRREAIRGYREALRAYKRSRRALMRSGWGSSVDTSYPSLDADHNHAEAVSNLYHATDGPNGSARRGAHTDDVGDDGAPAAREEAAAPTAVAPAAGGNGLDAGGAQGEELALRGENSYVYEAEPVGRAHDFYFGEAAAPSPASSPPIPPPPLSTTPRSVPAVAGEAEAPHEDQTAAPTVIVQRRDERRQRMSTNTSDDTLHAVDGIVGVGDGTRGEHASDGAAQTSDTVVPTNGHGGRRMSAAGIEPIHASAVNGEGDAHRTPRRYPLNGRVSTAEGVAAARRASKIDGGPAAAPGDTHGAKSKGAPPANDASPTAARAASRIDSDHGGTPTMAEAPKTSAATPVTASRKRGSDTTHKATETAATTAAAAAAAAEAAAEAALASAQAPLSLWEYLKEEVLSTDLDTTVQDVKWERVVNFIAIPFWMEKIILFGFAVCLDSFLYTFTILPIRFFLAAYLLVTNALRWVVGGERRRLHSSQKCDLLKGVLVASSCYILSRITDASKMYHSVRGQDVVKLYVIFNVLEIADRLCCSFGQDLLDSLFSRRTLARRRDGSQPLLRPLGFLVLSLGYVLAHTLVLFYQMVTLNVAINSYDNALLTLLLSNQFVEIKGSVFKKFEKENLFQLTCADIVERFQLTVMLSAIGLRNLIEVAGASSSGGGGGGGDGGGGAGGTAGAGPLPTSFTVFPSLNLIETIFTPVLIVLASECVVDWLKHAFITKFNHIRPAVYGRFMDVLCRDLVLAGPELAAAAAATSGTGTGAAATSTRKEKASNPPAPLAAENGGSHIDDAGQSCDHHHAHTSEAEDVQSAVPRPRPTTTDASNASTSSARTPPAPTPPPPAAPPRRSRRHAFVDQSPVVSRRLGFAALPLACLLVRTAVQVVEMLSDTSHYDECAVAAPPGASRATLLRGGLRLGVRYAAKGLGSGGGGAATTTTAAAVAADEATERMVDRLVEAVVEGGAWALTISIAWVALLALKLLLGANLVTFASHRYATMRRREAEEERNARDRPPIGNPREERMYEASNRQLVNRAEDDAASVGVWGERVPHPHQVRLGGGGGTAAAKVGVGGGGGGGGAGGINLMDVDRWMLLKSRIW